MTTAADELIARAKSIAVPLTKCVEARLSPGWLIGGMSREELAALVLVLAEAVDPAVLRAVVKATDDGPDVTDDDVRLRRAHAEAERLRVANREVPFDLRLLDYQYREARRQARAGSRGQAGGADVAAA